MTSSKINFSPKGLFIGGKWVDSYKGGRFSTINPSNGQHLGEVPLAEKEDVNRAVIAAKQAFQDWGKMPLKERAGFLIKLADKLLENRDELGMMDCVDSGNALNGMKGDVDWSSDSLKYFAGLISEIKGETFSEKPGHFNFTRRQPYGVVAKINPFNHPLRFCAEKSAAALAAGNTVIVKASEQAPLSSLRFAEICEEILNVLIGSMSTIGPRPHMVGEDITLEKNIDRYRMRRFVKPGITGAAQVYGFRGETKTTEDMKDRVEYDIWYLESWSLILDVKLILYH